MSYIKRRDAFFVAMVVVGAIAYFVFDIDTSSFWWPIQMGIVAGTRCNVVLQPAQSEQ